MFSNEGRRSAADVATPKWVDIFGAPSLLVGDVRNGVLVRPFFIVVPAPFRTYLVYPPRVASSPKLMSFRRWLRDEIAADQSAAR
jgi:DNA-binding transcriptional LysR family regulator